MKENKNKEKYLSLENLLNKQKEEIQMTIIIMENVVKGL